MRIRALVLLRFHGITHRLRNEPLDGEACTAGPTYGGLHMRRVIVVGGVAVVEGRVCGACRSAMGPCKIGAYERFGLRARKNRVIPAGRRAAKNQLMNDSIISCKRCH